MINKRYGSRLAAVLLMTSIVASGLTVVSVKAEESTSETSPILELVDENTIREHYDTLDQVELMYTQEETLSTLDMDEVKEVMDNGADLVISGTSVEEVEDAFESEMILEEDEGYNNVGCYVASDGNSYTITPIYTGLVYDDEEEVTEKQHEHNMEELAQLTSVDVEEVYEQVISEENTTEFLNEVSDEDLASLQVSTTIGNAYCDNSKFVYFYYKSGSGTDYIYSTSTTKEGYKKIGSLNMAVYALKVKTSDTTTYDNIYSVVTASGLNDKYVKRYDTNIWVTEATSNNIIDATSGSSSTSITGTIGTEVDASGAISASTSYRFNPNEQKVTSVLGEKYLKTWKCYPSSYTANASWKVRPAVLLKKTNGTSTTVTAKVYVDYFKLSGGVRTYTLKNTASCAISIKNHTEV